MKKMNLNFLDLRAKMVLPLFLLIGLFMLSASTVSAQFVTNKMAEQLITKHIAQIPPVKMTAVKVEDQESSYSKESRENLLRIRYGRAILRKVSQGSSIGEAIDEVYNIVAKKGPLDILRSVKNEYVDLLTKEE